MTVADWTDPDELRYMPGQSEFRSADWNAMLDNAAYLYAPVRFTVVRNVAQAGISSQSDTLLEFNDALVDQAPWGRSWFSYDTGSLTVPRDGTYLLNLRLLWPNTAAGSYRRVRFLRNGDPIGGERLSASVATEQSVSMVASLTQGRILGVDLRHDAGEDLTLVPSMGPWRSPIFSGQWLGPLGVE